MTDQPNRKDLPVFLIVIYLAAIVAANLALAAFGPVAAVPVGFVLIGLDLTTRDKLHDRWGSSRRGLVLRMAALIAAGGAISYVLNADAGRIAVASTVAFAVAAVVDGLTYAALANRSPRTRSALSNVPAAAVDSWLFLALAFPGPAPLVIVVVQWLAKSLGGAVWALALYRRRQRPPATLDEAIRRDLYGPVQGA